MSYIASLSLLRDDPILNKFNSGCKLSCFQSPLSQRLSEIVLNQTWQKDWDGVQKSFIEGLASKEYSKLQVSLRSILRELTPLQFHQLLEEVARRKIGEGSREVIAHCMELLTSEELQKLQKENPALMDHRMDLMAACEKMRNDRIYNDPSTGCMRYVNKCTGFIHGMMDTILVAFSFFEMGREPSSNWDAHNLLQIYGQLFAAPFFLLTIISGLTASATTALLTTGGIVLVLLLLLYVYVKYIKPTPQHFKGCMNLSAAARRGELPPVVGRNSKTQEVIDAIVRGERVVIVGKSRVGKSTFLSALAQAMAIHPNPEIRKIDLIDVPTSKTLEVGLSLAQDSWLERLITKIEPHKKFICPVMNEFHVAFMPENLARTGTRFNDLFDRLPQSWTNCMAVTTDVGYQKYICPTDMRGRLKPIFLDQMEDKEIFEVLEATAELSAPEMTIPKEIFETIVSASKAKLPKLMQPAVSKMILEAVIDSIKQAEFRTPLEKEYMKLKTDYEAFCKRIRIADPRAIDERIMAEAARIRGELGLKEAERAAEQEKFRVLKQLKAEKVDLKHKQYKLALEIQQSPAVNEALRKQMLFNHFYYQPLLDQEIKRRSEELQLPELSVKFVNEFVEKEKELFEKIEKDIRESEDRSQAEIKARSSWH